MKLAIAFNGDREDALGWLVVRAARDLGLEATQVSMRDAAHLPAAYDAYLRVDYGDYAEDLPDALRPRLFYAVDTHLAHSWRKIRRMAPRYDLVACAQHKAADALPNGAWVALGWDPTAHARRPLPPRWDVASVATEGGVPRKFLLQALRERYPNHYIGGASGSHVGAIYSQSRIGFNYSIRDDLNMRVFEVLAAGTLLVTNRLPHHDLAELGFREGEHYVAYGGPKDLYSVIDRYLHDEPTRRTIAEAGLRAVQSHTYAHRLHQLLTLAAERLHMPVLRPPTLEATPCMSS